MGQEVELKLCFPRTALAALRRHPILAADTTPVVTTLDNTYFDTPDLVLKKLGIALRTRRRGRSLLQTVKCASDSAGGLSIRPEWEQAWRGSFDFSAIDAPRIRKRLLRAQAGLTPLFSTRFRRETRRHRPQDGVSILLMIDTGEIRCQGRAEPICELELELEQGAPLDLLLLACRLTADLPLLPSDASKAERGYALFLDQEPEPMRAEHSAIDATMTPVEAFRTLAHSCVRQWQFNAAHAAGSENPEFIHQLRVSQRRLRSLLRIFRPALPAEFANDWAERLRRNANRFGDARDLDVLCEEILAPVTSIKDLQAEALSRMQEIALAERDQTRSRSVADLDTAEQGRLLTGFMAAVHALPDPVSGQTPAPAKPNMALRRLANRRIERLRRRVRERHDAAHGATPEHLHELRVALKQLRYAIDFLSPLLRDSGKRTKALTRIQNDLGFVNDLDVACQRLGRWAGEDPQLCAAAAFVCGWHAARSARLGKRALKALTPLLAGRSPWRA